MEVIPTIAFLGILAVTWIAYTVVYNLFYSPLSRFPGPKLWAVSPIPYALSIVRGRNHLDVHALHARYGPAVRLSPNELAFNTPAAARDIYGVRHGHGHQRNHFFHKDRHYRPCANGVDSVNSAVDHAVHARHRKLLAHAFSERAVREHEGGIVTVVDKLVAKLRAQTQAPAAHSSNNRNHAISAVVDIKSWINFTTFDVTGDLMLGESFGCLDSSALHPWIATIFDALKFVILAGAANKMPRLRAAIGHLVPAAIKRRSRQHFDALAEKIDRRLAAGAASKPDFVSAMLRNGMSEKEVWDGSDRTMTRAELHSNAFFLMTTSDPATAAVSGALYYLCKNPSAMRRLIDEVRGAFAASEYITLGELARLPYLNAVLKETLRIYPPLATSAPRIVSSGGDTVDGYWVPENTIVATHQFSSHRSPNNFAEPDTFAPERWLDEDPRFAADRRDAWNPFSLGPRDCAGQNHAWASLRLILSKLVFNFDFELREESDNWTDQQVYFLWEKPPLMVNMKARDGC